MTVVLTSDGDPLLSKFVCNSFFQSAVQQQAAVVAVKLDNMHLVPAEFWYYFLTEASRFFLRSAYWNLRVLLTYLQVSHHPPVTAHHADGKKWTMHQDFAMTSRFRGKYLSVIPIGYTYVKARNYHRVFCGKLS